jgi:hypothetical protein
LENIVKNFSEVYEILVSMNNEKLNNYTNLVDENSDIFIFFKDKLKMQPENIRTMLRIWKVFYERVLIVL